MPMSLITKLNEPKAKKLIIFCILILFVSVKSQSCFNDYGKQKFNGTCSFVDNCEGAALKGNCGNSLICCIKDIENVPNIPENSLIKKSLFLKLVGNTPRNEKLYYFFIRSMESSEIFNQYKVGAYFSTLIGESNYFKDFESKFDDPDFNSDLGNNATGDGTLYRGRGAILVRGKTNYILAQNKLTNLGK